MDPDRTGINKADPKIDPRDPPASPYGPQPHGVDEAAGGADSSPHDDEPADARRAKADEDRRTGRPPDNNDGPAGRG